MAVYSKEVNLLTTTGASGFKDEIESKTLKDFKHDAKDLNT